MPNNYLIKKELSDLTPPCNDISAELLNGLFGADKDKLKQNLSRIHSLGRLSAKEKAELYKGIDIAKTFFETFEFEKAHGIIVDNLELKIQRAD